MKSPLQGLIAAPHTPFSPQGELAEAVIPRQAALLMHNGVSGAFICGTTGEGSSLTQAERRRVAEAWRAAADERLKVIVHVGHLCGAESADLARHAEQIGADAIAAIAPSFFRPPSVHELVAWCASVASAAPRTPFFYYHMPAMTGVNVSVAEFIPEAEKRIPTFAGIKFTHEDLMDYGQSVALARDKYRMLFGRDEVLLSALALGADGAVGSTYNYAAPLYLRLIESFRAGRLDDARADQARSRAFIALLGPYGGFAAGKAIMKLIGVDCGPVRLPLRAMDDSTERALRAALDKVGFFEHCSRLP
jgi:N-acetylneuraminate lyase